MTDSERTIFAPATSIGESSITVIRVSGRYTFDILSRLFSKKADNL
jgi:tRNA U34 5-carboxymethylaminomethyl modifying GTPase MnmE/TrmE